MKTPARARATSGSAASERSSISRPISRWPPACEVQAQSVLAGFLGPDVLPESLVAADALDAPAPPQAVPALIAHALANRGDYRATQISIEQFEAERKAAAQLQVPTPVFAGGLKHSNTSIASSSGYQFSIDVALPLFSRGQAATAAATAQKLRAELETDSWRIRIEAEVRATHALLAVHRDRAARYRESAAAVADPLASTVRVGYEEGEFSILGVARRRATSARWAAAHPRPHRRSASRGHRSGPRDRTGVETMTFRHTCLTCVDVCRRGFCVPQHASASQPHPRIHPTVAVTVWSERTELFMEYPPLVAGQQARFAIHLTDLSNFTPLREGKVIVRFEGDTIQRFEVDGPSSPGIFGVDVKVARGAPLSGRGRGAQREAQGRSRSWRCHCVSGSGLRGRRIAPDEEGATAFLKEQQWTLDFATIRVDSLPRRQVVSAGHGRTARRRKR